MSQKRPNLIIVMVDNQTAEALRCYGNAEVHTPNIDRLSREGMQFDGAYSANALCSPGRASALTGLMPSQHGVHSWLDDRSLAQWGPGWSAISEFHSLPQVLNDRGYVTGLIGKYHLGVPHAPQNGFQHWVALVRGHTLSFYDSVVVKNGLEQTRSGHSVDVLTDEAIGFVEACAQDAERPFFLFLAYNGPYGHHPAVQRRADNRFAALYGDCPMTSVPRFGLSQAAIDYVELQLKTGIRGKGGPDYYTLLKSPNDLPLLRNYYSQISMVDDGVGRLMAALKSSGLDENTLVIYTADHGFSLGHHGFWGHGVATWPANAHRVAYNIPMILRHPGGIAAGRRSPRLISSVDLYATLTAYLAIDDVPRNHASPSRSFAPLLQERAAAWDDAVFIDQEETRALRTPDWLYLRRFTGSKTYVLADELYDLRNDPGESRNLIGESTAAATATALASRLDGFFARHSEAKYDLWKGGTPKSNSSRPWLWRDAWGPEWNPTGLVRAPA
jgi:arylsulfatase A-like enzyme